MSNLPSLDPQALETITGGAAVAPLLHQLTSLSSTIKDIGAAAKKTGFSTTQVLLLGMLLNQRSQVNVFVRRPFW